MYGKIYEQTFTGSMYGSGSHIFSVWSYVIAHTKPDAMVELNPVDLSHRIGEDLSRIIEAIEHFKSPDPNSRSHEFEGRRLIQKGEYIYFVPQYHKYHGFANNKERREYFAAKKREQRQRDKERQTVKSKMSNNVKQSDTYTESKNKEEEGANGSRLQSIEVWLKELSEDKTYEGLDVRKEYGKMVRWCSARRKQPTQRRFVNWLNGADQVLKLTPTKPDYKRNYLPPANEPTEEELAAQRKIVREASEKLKEQLRL